MWRRNSSAPCRPPSRNKQASAPWSVKLFAARSAYLRAKKTHVCNKRDCSRRPSAGSREQRTSLVATTKAHGLLQHAQPARAPIAPTQRVSPQLAMAHSTGARSCEKRTSSRGQSTRACLVSVASSSLAGLRVTREAKHHDATAVGGARLSAKLSYRQQCAGMCARRPASAARSGSTAVRRHRTAPSMQHDAACMWCSEVVCAAMLSAFATCGTSLRASGVSRTLLSASGTRLPVSQHAVHVRR